MGNKECADLSSTKIYESL